MLPPHLTPAAQRHMRRGVDRVREREVKRGRDWCKHAQLCGVEYIQIQNCISGVDNRDKEKHDTGSKLSKTLLARNVAVGTTPVGVKHIRLT